MGLESRRMGAEPLLFAVLDTSFFAVASSLRDNGSQAASQTQRRAAHSLPVTVNSYLAADAQISDQGAIAFNIFTLEVIQELAALRDDLQQATTAVMIF